jgi:hypothetical protein
MSGDQYGVEQKSWRNIHVVYYWVLGAELALLILGLTLSPKRLEVPPELQGVWRTNDTHHSDRSFEISALTLTFGTGDGTSSTGFIRHIDLKPEGAESLYTITYAGNDGNQTLSMSYDPAKQVLHFNNQPSIEWKKESTD